MTDKISLPSWAISDEDAKKLIPPDGLIHDYMMYMKDCTDAPIIYHYGVITTILSCAVSNADIICEQEEKKSGFECIVTTPMWSALIGSSAAARKSSSMDVGIRLLERAEATTASPSVVLPPDGSLEGWHDYMTEQNNVIMYRDELATMFDQARRGYSEGLKHWLMEMYSGKQKARVTVGTKAKKKTDEEEEYDNQAKVDSSCNRRVVERPRISILGGIPPSIFAEKSGTTDWESGFLGRFVFWPGVRTEWRHQKNEQGATETQLARHLAKICQVEGRIIIPWEVNKLMINWFWNTIEKHRMSMPEALYSHQARYMDLVTRLAAMHAVARSERYQAIEVFPADMKLAIQAGDLLVRSSSRLFSNTNREAEKGKEAEVLEYIKSREKPISISDMKEQLPYSIRSLYRILDSLYSSGDISRRKDSSVLVGRKPWLYSASPQA